MIGADAVCDRKRHQGSHHSIGGQLEHRSITKIAASPSSAIKISIGTLKQSNGLPSICASEGKERAEKAPGGEFENGAVEGGWAAVISCPVESAVQGTHKGNGVEAVGSIRVKGS